MTLNKLSNFCDIYDAFIQVYSKLTIIIYNILKKMNEQEINLSIIREVR